MIIIDNAYGLYNGKKKDPTGLKKPHTVSYQTRVLINTTVWNIGAFCSRLDLLNYRQSAMTNKPNYEVLDITSFLVAGLQDGCVLSQNVSLSIIICLF